MANYCYVENGEVVEKCDVLPSSWRNVSGLDRSGQDEALLNSLGWYSVTKVTVDCDPETQFIADYQYVLQGNTVLETPIIQARTDNPPSVDLKSAWMGNLRNVRDMLLSQCDWTQTVDIQSARSATWIQNWAAYRQSLRDLPASYENTTITSLTTPVNWPSAPSSGPE